jgi:hypothetical protein
MSAFDPKRDIHSCPFNELVEVNTMLPLTVPIGE